MTDSTIKDTEAAAEMQVAATLAAALIQRRGQSNAPSSVMSYISVGPEDAVSLYRRVRAALRKPESAHAAPAEDGS